MPWEMGLSSFLGGSTALMFLGMPVAISFLAINIIGTILFLGGEAGLQRKRFSDHTVPMA